jgi:protein-tyrosine sulfotransferase
MKAETIAGHPPPIFILSDGRSDATLIQQIITAHPEIGCPGELGLGGLCERLIHVVGALSMGQAGGQSGVKSSPEEMPRFVYAEVNRIVAELMNTYAKSQGKHLWCDQSPDNLDYLPVLKQVFADAKYICLYRNCLDIVNSGSISDEEGRGMIDSACHARNESEICAYVDRWIDQTSKLLAFEREQTDRRLRVRYEDFIFYPVEVLNEVFGFIGVTWDLQLLDSILTTNPSASGGLRPVFMRQIQNSSLGNEPSISWRIITGELVQKMNELLERLDYPLVWQTRNQSQASSAEAFAQKSEGSNSGESALTSEIIESVLTERLKLAADRLRGIKGVCQVVITGDEVNAWMIDLNIPGGKIKTAGGKADCTITTTPDDLLNMIDGKLNPSHAFIQGRIRVAGDMELAKEVARIFVSD